MITYLPPTPPDYDRIINEELARIRDYSYIKDPAKRSEMEKTIRSIKILFIIMRKSNHLKLLFNHGCYPKN